MTQSNPFIFPSSPRKLRENKDLIFRDCHDVSENYAYAPGEEYPKPTHEELVLAVGIIADELIRHGGVVTFDDLGVNISSLIHADFSSSPTPYIEYPSAS